MIRKTVIPADKLFRYLLKIVLLKLGESSFLIDSLIDTCSFLQEACGELMLV